MPEPEIAVEPDGLPLVNSAWSWAEQTRRLIASKRLRRGGRGRAMTAPVPDLDQARRFLALLDEEAPAFTFQTATDAEPKPRSRSPRPGDQSAAR